MTIAFECWALHIKGLVSGRPANVIYEDLWDEYKEQLKARTRKNNNVTLLPRKGSTRRS